MRGRLTMLMATVVLAAARLANAAAAPTLTHAEREAGWALLFNGKSLAGWTQSAGDAEAWAVNADGELYVAKPGAGWWLRTDKMYRDFELTLEFWLPEGEGANSGVGIRGSSDGDPAFTGMEIQILDTHGQTPDEHNCGAVYEAIAPSVMAVNPAGQWNSYRILLVGDTLNVWLNGVRIHAGQKIDDRGYYRTPENPLPMNARATTGYISLQDHGHAVRFRNIRIRDLSPDPEPDGMTPVKLTDEGLMRKGGGSWEGGGRTIIGKDGPGHLFTEEMPGDLEIRALVKVNARGNSGLYFRTVPNAQNPDSWPTGYEAQVDNHDPRNFTGCIYDRAHPVPPHPTKCLTRDEVWFDYRVRAEGDHIRTWINGIPVVDTRLTNFDKGRIALQTHNPGSVIEYRDLRWVQIDAE